MRVGLYHANAREWLRESMGGMQDTELMEFLFSSAATQTLLAVINPKLLILFGLTGLVRAAT